MCDLIQYKWRPLQPGLAFIFDMDGVIVDSNPLHREAWTAYNIRHGLVTTEEMHERMYGKRNDEIVRDFFGEHLSAEEVAAHGAAKEELYREMAAGRLEDMLVPGIRDFLDFYSDVPKGLATNAEEENVRFVLDRASLRPHFNVVVSGKNVRNPKPLPDIYLKVADLLGVAPADCIVFEDSHSGAQAAIAAGMRLVGLSTTYGYLSGTSITVDNFRSGNLHQWLAAQTCSG